MKKTNVISLVIFIFTIISVVAAVLIFPDTVQVQRSSIANVTTTLPKLWAILLASVLSLTGAVGVLVSKKEEPQKYHTLIFSVIGIFLFIYMFLVN